jgi:short-subunit dehydrogenase
MQTTLITGASSGIGESLAGHFAAGGSRLVLVARSEQKLKQIARQLESLHSVEVSVETADLSRRGAAKKLAAALKARGIPIDTLVNCAGVLEHGSFVDNGPVAHRQILDLNISGLTSMLDEFLPGMVERGAGRVLNVASIASFQPVPSLAVYAASKAYVLSLTESLSEELKGTGVTVTALCPGLTATNMLNSAQQKSGGLNVPGFMIGDVDDVARQGYKACMAGEVICVPGAINLAVTLGSRAAPKWLLRRVSGLAGRLTTKS